MSRDTTRFDGQTQAGGFRSGSQFASHEFDTTARQQMQGAFDAVVGELGVDTSEAARRDAIASRIATTWRQGPRMPLNLVHAGLDAACA